MKTKEELLSHCREYVDNINLSKCNAWEKALVALCKEHEYSFETYYYIKRELSGLRETAIQAVRSFLMSDGNLPHILPEDYSQYLALYVKSIGNYSDTKGLFRIDVRRVQMDEDNTERLLTVYRSFFAAAAYGLTLDELICGQVPDLGGGYFRTSYAPVLAGAILQGNPETISAIKEVLTSENNVGILTRDLITAIECADNDELHSLLLDVLRAAKLQEGLRQSIVECGNEYSLKFYKRMIEVVAEENMLRYSSVRRAVQTWAGLGYIDIADKDIKTIFEGIRRFLMNSEECEKAYQENNALLVYVALYCTGSEDYDRAEQTALRILDSNVPLQNRIAAIYYLRRSSYFLVTEHFEFFANNLDDKFVFAFFVEQLCDSKHSETISYGKTKRVSGRERDMFKFFFEQIADRLTVAKAREEYKFKGFEWFGIRLERQHFINALWFFACQLKDSQYIDYLLMAKLPVNGVTFTSTNSYFNRNLDEEPIDAFMKLYYPTGSAETRRYFLIKNAFSFDEEHFERFLPYFRKEEFTDSEVKEIEKKVLSKVSDTRNKAVQALLTLPYQQLSEVYNRLQNIKADYIPAALVELREGNQQLAKDFACDVQEAEPVNYPGPEGGYGLYKVGSIPDIIPYNPFDIKEKKSLLGKLVNRISGHHGADASVVFTYTYEKLCKLYADLESIIVANADKEYKTEWGEYTLGEDVLWHVNKDSGIDNLPYPELWKGFLNSHPIKDEELVGIDIMLRYIEEGNFYSLISFEASNNPLEKRMPGESWKYRKHLETIIEDLMLEAEQRNPSALFKSAYNLLALIYFYCPSNQGIDYYAGEKPRGRRITVTCVFCWAIRYAQSYWRSREEEHMLAEMEIAMFKKYASIKDEEDYFLDDHYMVDMFLLADYHLQGKISDDAVFEMLLHNNIDALSCKSRLVYVHRGNKLVIAYEDNKALDLRYSKDVYENLRHFFDRIAQHLFKIEMTRKNAPTVATELISHIGTVMTLQGVSYLAKAMKTLGNDHLTMDTYGTERRDVLARIIEQTFPLPTDKPTALKGIKEDQLLELAFFAPQWQPLVKAYLGWEGFDLAYYYFVAHTKEMGYSDKQATVALYTDLSPEDLYAGAFDETLFHEAYTAVGEKRFALFYKAARYISSSNFHSRARRFADTVLGKISEEELAEQVTEKRNKDALCSLGLLPDKSDEALLRRYQLIQAFLKESKKFGAQRQASEKRACEVALINLSRGAGYADPIQLTWWLESQQVAEHKELLEGIKVEGYTLNLDIATDGTNKLIIMQGEKKLRSVPAALKKHPDYLRMAAIGKEWTQQRRRARAILEDMMERQTVLRPKDAEVIAHNPIVSPMFRLLLLRQGKTIGFYTEKGLETLNGIVKLKADEPLTIAHACQLYADKSWGEWQRFIFSKKIVQPFKQVFREIYVPMSEEADSHESRRYSGYQIQVRQAAAALRGRGWSADYEGGLRKVFYKQGIAVELYAQADWFTPADVEAPAIEYVSFYSTRGSERLKIANIDPILYSEVMRDVDMTVSIAFVGGVDPETGSSTKELRASIVECTAELMKFKNVSVSDNFIHIKGTLADYTVHLGSGLVRQVGGTEIPIIPVHGQHRGKLYLPFMDEDPKTVEIVSKVVLLSEDNKLKDPTILKWIQRA